MALDQSALAEKYFSLMQSALGEMQSAFRTERDMDGASAESIAEALGLSPYEIMKILSGQKEVTLREIHNVLRAMGWRLRIEVEPLPAKSN